MKKLPFLPIMLMVGTLAFLGCPNASEPAAEYEISVAADKGAAVNPSAKKAKAGETVKFTVTLDDGYTLVSVSANGEKLNPDKSGGYTFTMPSESVTITVKVTPLPRQTTSRPR